MRGVMDSYLHRLQQAITSATRGMTIEQLTSRAEGKWSAAEILEHLYLTYSGTVKGMERCLQLGKPLAVSQRTQLEAASLRHAGCEAGLPPQGKKVARSRHSE